MMMDDDVEERLDDLQSQITNIRGSVETLTETMEIFVDQMESDGGFRQPDELVEQISTGASMRSEITRGTGTRDQEKHVLKGKGENAEEAMMEYETMLQRLENEYAEQIRNLQPELEEEEGGDDGDN